MLLTLLDEDLGFWHLKLAPLRFLRFSDTLLKGASVIYFLLNTVR